MMDTQDAAVSSRPGEPRVPVWYPPQCGRFQFRRLKTLFAGILRKPSDGLEPSTPS